MFTAIIFPFPFVHMHFMQGKDEVGELQIQNTEFVILQSKSETTHQIQDLVAGLPGHMQRLSCRLLPLFLLFWLFREKPALAGAGAAQCS